MTNDNETGLKEGGGIRNVNLQVLFHIRDALALFRFLYYLPNNSKLVDSLAMDWTLNPFQYDLIAVVKIHWSRFVGRDQTPFLKHGNFLQNLSGCMLFFVNLLKIEKLFVFAQVPVVKIKKKKI